MTSSRGATISRPSSHIQLQIRWLEAVLISELLDCWLDIRGLSPASQSARRVQGGCCELIRKASVKDQPAKAGYALGGRRSGFAHVLLSRVLDDKKG
jgi:hypothetical protein